MVHCTKIRNYRIYLQALILTSLAAPVELSLGQQPSELIVPLTIKQPYHQSMVVAWIEFEDGHTGSAKDKTRSSMRRVGRLPGGLAVAVDTVGERSNACKVSLDTDSDGDLADETPVLINLDSEITVHIRRNWEAGKTATLPYVLRYARSGQGPIGEETFYWRPAYVASGKLKTGECEASINVLDVNGDGVFDRRDFQNAATIHIDDGSGGDSININDSRVVRHADGRIEIPQDLHRSLKKKWFKGEEKIDFCGESYDVDRVELDGTAITLVRSDLKIPRVGEPLPEMVMTTLNGEAIDLKKMQGVVTLLDFWASWCRPCVEKFATVKQIVDAHRGKLNVIAINVDESSNLPAAHQVIEQYQLDWPHVARGLGERDPLWKVFGSMSNNGLSVPLYVLVDRDGLIKYAGNGDKDLFELRDKVKELFERK